MTDDPSAAAGSPAPGDRPPDFSTWEEPAALIEDQPTRERLLDVALQLREPTTVADVAERAACDPGTARDYLAWFADAGIVREHEGRPVRYEVNRSYLRWRRVEDLRREYTEEEIVAELDDALATLREYRERFDAPDPDEVSVLAAASDDTVAAVWEALSDWKTTRERAALLDAARRGGVVGDGAFRVDA